MSRDRLTQLLLVAALVGCGSNPPPPATDAGTDSGATDAGPLPDARPPTDAPMAMPVCTAPRAITLTMGAQMITGDTTGRANDLDLGDGCGDPDATAAPQEAIAITLPGTGQVGVTFTMANAGTAADFDTIVQLQRGECGSLTMAEGCAAWDDIAYPDETRSAGQFVAMGGETVYLIVSGYTTDQSGPWQMDVEVVDVHAPTLTGATVRRVDAMRFDVVDVMGGDVDGDALGVRIAFLDSAGAAIAFDDDGNAMTPNVMETAVGFVTSVEGMMTFTARATLPVVIPTATQARVAVLDAFGLASSDVMVSIADVMESGRGETCNATMVCAESFECTAGTCAIPASVATLCAAATPVVITPGTTTVTTSVMGTIPAMAGSILGTCGNTRGAEVLYTVTVPAAVAPVTAYDVVASTDTETTGDADTVLYIQSTCGDPETVMGRCNDDIDGAGGNYHSLVDARALAAGTYTIAVESFGIADAATPFGLDVSLRPVLGTGTACDPAGVMNRCAAGACPSGASPVCP